jgi:hypothetical protein
MNSTTLTNEPIPTTLKAQKQPPLTSNRGNLSFKSNVDNFTWKLVDFAIKFFISFKQTRIAKTSFGLILLKNDFESDYGDTRLNVTPKDLLKGEKSSGPPNCSKFSCRIFKLGQIFWRKFTKQRKSFATLQEVNDILRVTNYTRRRKMIDWKATGFPTIPILTQNTRKYDFQLHQHSVYHLHDHSFSKDIYKSNDRLACDEFPANITLDCITSIVHMPRIRPPLVLLRCRRT